MAAGRAAVPATAGRERSPVVRGRGTAPVHHGELLQGAFEGPGGVPVRALVTLPCPPLTTRAVFTPARHGGAGGVTVRPAWRSKARRAAELTLDGTGLSGRLKVAGGMPLGRGIHVPSVVVSQARRDSRRQVRLGRLLAGCRVVPVGLETAEAAGILCGKAGTSDVVDATVVTMAASLGAIIWTSDPDGIRTLIDAQGIKPAPVIRTV
ncbi:hypothetical protein [Streptomyces antibioticus]|uniref:hypothetical protein n=1 Tax=Streptomyces antibioticus TaxID=1890 RepID=UPI003D73E4DF